MARPPRSQTAARTGTTRGGGKRTAKGDTGTATAGKRTAAKRRPKPQPLEHRLLLTAILCLLAGGAVMVYSASSARTLLEGQGDGTAYLVKYLMYGSAGLVAMHVISRHGLQSAQRFTTPLLAVAFVLVLAVHVPGLGVTVNGAKRWLGAGPLTFQPSEIMKLALILHASS